MTSGFHVGQEGLACNLHFSSSQRWLIGVEIRILCSSVKFFHTKFIKLHLYSPCFMHWGRVIMWKDKEAILNRCHKVGNIMVLSQYTEAKSRCLFFRLGFAFHTLCTYFMCMSATPCFLFLVSFYGSATAPPTGLALLLQRFGSILEFRVDEAISRNNVMFTTQSLFYLF